MMKIVLFLVTFIWTEMTSARNYEVYWNVPTTACHQYGLNFEEVEKNYEIIQNRNDEFRGDKIVIMYEPGMFPAISKHPNGSAYLRNGGVPQNGDLQRHLDLFEADVKQQIAKDFSGLGIIDFECWRPIFKQNWAGLQSQRDMSVSIESQNHPSWSNTSITQEAIRRFEEAGKNFMKKTLELAKNLRPKASWGYYGYPHCYNSISTTNSRCDEVYQQDNDNMSWLWELQDILLPSVYLKQTLSMTDKKGLIEGRLQESKRIINKFSLSSKILPYFRYSYIDQNDRRLSSEDIDISFNAMLANGANGHIIWGSSNDFRSKQQCEEFFDYLRDTLGPAVLKIKKITRPLDYSNQGRNESCMCRIRY